MTKEQKKDRRDHLDAIGKQIRSLMDDYFLEDDKATEHMERARAHIQEAWLDADGQHARSVPELVTHIEEATALFRAVAQADVGTEFKVGGKTFVKQQALIL